MDLRTLPIRVQAKKLQITGNNYRRIDYTKNGVRQVDQLIRHAAADGLGPIYSFYASVMEPGSCRGRVSEGGVYLASTYRVRNELLAHRRALLADVLAISNPLPCLFSCDLLNYDNLRVAHARPR